MNSGNWFLIAVVAVAFIAGYSIVSFMIKKMKSQHHTATPGEGQAGQSQQEGPKSKVTTEESARSDASHGGDRQDQQQRREEEQARERSETWESQSEEQRYGRILGLGGQITAADVKQSYRELLAKYHPDKVNHLGDEFKRIAEVRTREILDAYDYFRKKYDIR
ncbi:MAG: DnaJ domain-containing protein [Deltaproteobacteria bacterium]|nr:DnaJ domain-containing protein [Deltaproteobacteria bacterium]